MSDQEILNIIYDIIDRYSYMQDGEIERKKFNEFAVCVFRSFLNNKLILDTSNSRMKSISKVEGLFTDFIL